MNEEDNNSIVEALQFFNEAIDDMISGAGLSKMSEAWHHTPDVTGKHPSGGWAHGWDEVWATWQLLASFGRPEHAGSRLVPGSVNAHVYGDVAYATSMVQASPAWGGERMMCTNVLRRIDGRWKLLHHHADPSAKMAEALERMLLEAT